MAYTIKKLNRNHADSYVRDKGYMVNGVLIDCVRGNAAGRDVELLSFQSDLKANLEQVIGSFNLPLPDSFTRRGQRKAEASR